MARQRLLWPTGQSRAPPAHPSAASSNKSCSESTKMTSQPLWTALSTAAASRCFLAKLEGRQAAPQASQRPVWHIAADRVANAKVPARDTGAAVLASRPELSARLAAARVQGLGKQLAESREALRRKSEELCAVAHEAAQLRKERAQLQRHAASLEAQVCSAFV